MAGAVAVGVMRVVLHIPESHSLKERRQVVLGLVRRIRSELGLAVAEVTDGDRWQIAELAIACVSNERQHADEMLARALSFIESRSAEAVVGTVTTEILSV